MKKYLVFGMMGAIALTFTACSTSDEDLALQDNLEKGVVKTEFNISTLGKTRTRMSDATTQYANPANTATLDVFRGMQDIVLIPYAKAGDIAAADPRIGDNIAIATTLGQKSTELSNNGNNSKLYENVEVAVGTQSFLFYGQATAQNASSPYTAEQINGKLTPAAGCFTTQTAENIIFSLSSIVADNNIDATKRNALIALLNAIVDAGNMKGVEGATDAQKWNNGANPLNALYNNFITMAAGSSENVRALVEDLYTALMTKSDATSTNIKDVIKKYTNVTVTEDETAKTATVAFAGDLVDYPTAKLLPQGAAIVAWNTTDNKFEAATALTYNTFNVSQPTDYVYPPSLWYRTNSRIVVANESKKAAYSKQTTWDNVLKQYNSDITPGVVSGETKSIAIIKQIEYAVGRLDLTVSTNGAASLTDKNKDSFELTTDGKNNFPITGVLIGGQKAVDYQFAPISSETAKTIYDCHVVDCALTAAGTTNRTLVLETASTDRIVNFAVELQNNSGKDFVSNHGVVPAGCKFYLIGQINIDDATTGAVSKVEGIDQIFLQDYYTTVNAKVTSLSGAYNVIPDLRAPKLELGLSVNVNWQAANTYSVTLE
ncbi:MAG: hypothetical protein IJV24_01935 [Prevotella sp.]|nr:hypothetical protein [Prevotella sp.]